MTLTKNLFKYLLVAGLFFISVQNKGYAGGFPVRPGSLLLSPSVNYFFANKQWDSLGVKKPFANNGKYTSINFSLYAEYGISRRFSFVALLPYVINNYQQSNYQSKSSGVTDLETGIKYYIGNINYVYYFTVQATAITPLYTNPNLGYKENGAELKFSFAGSGQIGSKNYYFTVENGFRDYFGSNGPFQDRYNASFGLILDRKFKQQVLISAGGFYSTSTTTQFFPNQAINRNFSFDQVSLSYGYAFTKQFSVFLSAGTFVYGRNTGDGSSASVSFILRPFKGF